MKLTNRLVLINKNNTLLILNGEKIKPVFVRRGQEHVAGILKKLEGIEGDRNFLAKHAGNDTELIDFLISHEIIVKEENTPRKEKKEGCECCGDGRRSAALYMLISQKCNQACVYCYNGKETYKSQSNLLMTEDIAFLGLRKTAGSISPGGTLEVVFFGGEPLLNWNLAKKIIVFCEEILRKEYPELNVKYHITTNLTLMPEDMVEWAKRHNMTFLCDIDGDEELHNKSRPFRNGKGSHATSVKNIRKLIEEGLSVSLRTTVTSLNQKHIVEIARHHKELGGSGTAFVMVNAINSDEEILDEGLLPDPDVVSDGMRELVRSGIWEPEQIFPFNEYLHRIYPGFKNKWCCGAPFGNTPVLDINGDIYACIYLVGIGKYKLGDIRDESEYPDRSVIKDIMGIINIDNHSECSKCEIKYICGGGCPVGRLLIESNDKASPEIVRYTRQSACSMNRTMIEEALWYYAEKQESIMASPIS